MSDYLPELLLAWSIQWMGVISPGPSVALLLGVATTQGRAASIVTAFGIACASIVLSLATVLGITAAFAQVADIMTVIRIVGAAYLAWLAYKAFRRAATPPQIGAVAMPARSAWRTGLTGFVLQLSNPKAIFFWLAIAAVGGLATAPWPVIAVFVVIAFVNSFVGHGAYAWVLSSAPIRKVYDRIRRWIDATLGCFFAFASYKLATEKL